MKPLSGRTVLFIGIGFYDYENAIAGELEALGAKVLSTEELPAIASKSFITPLLRRLRIDLKSAIRHHHEKILERARAIPRLDYVFVIKGEHLEKWFLDALRAAHPRVTMISYHWDSMARYPELMRRQVLFDQVFTFDHADAQAHPEFCLRPLFFRKELAANSAARIHGRPRYDLSFVGWLHHQRLRQIEQISAWADTQKLSKFFYLYTGQFSRMRLRLQGHGQFVKARPLGYAEYVKVMADTGIVVDLPHPLQTGLTMRAIEALGAGKKLVTTAREIVKYDFYNPQNILLIDAEHPHIDLDFISRPPAPADAAITGRYTLNTWILDIFGLNGPPSMHQYIPAAKNRWPDESKQAANH